MYTIYLDNDLFYDPRIPELALKDMTCEFEVNKTGTLKFLIPATHPQKDSIRKMYSELTLYQDEEWLYSGRVLSDDVDFYGNRTIECEGELSYLLDSIQRYHEYHDISVRDYFTDLITKHNADVDRRKYFTVGQVTVTDSNDSLYRYSTYENTWKTIEDRLLSRLGGYIRIRHEDGRRVIDYVEDYGHTNDQVIRFGENILDLIQEGDCDSLATVIVPLGKRDDETDERLTIKSVNGGLDYLVDTDAVDTYGRIVKTVEFDDVTLPENLMEKGREVLNKQKILRTCITITAVDLHLLDVDIERCNVGDHIRVVSEPHGIDDFMMIQKIHLDLLEPQNSKLTLGATLLTLASSVSRGTAAVLTSLSDNFTSFKHVVTDKLQAANADIGALHAELGEFDTMLATKADLTELNATNANVQALQAADTRIEHMVAEKAAITDLNATNANVSSLQASTANIESILAGNAGVGTLQAIHLTGDNIVIEDATIAQAVMDDLMAGRVTAKTIYTDFITIASRDGSLSIEGSTIQIKDSDNTVRVQIGRDGSGNYSYYLWDASGNLIWSPEGITANGVPDGLIVNSMVANNAAIDGSKLNIRSIARGLENDGTLTVDAAHVVMDDTTLEANYQTMTAQIAAGAQQTQTLQTGLQVVQGQIQQKVWQSDITEAVTPLGSSITQLSDQYTSQQQTINGMSTQIGNVQTSLESKADGSTVQALTARVSTVEETAEGFSRRMTDIKTEVDGAVTDVTVYYMLNDSETVPPAEDDPGWSRQQPEWTEGMYVWQKTVTTYAGGTSRSEITLTSWYEAAAAVLDSLEIGGRNLLPDSDAGDLTKVSAAYDRYFSDPAGNGIVPQFFEVDDAPVQTKHGTRYTAANATGQDTGRELCWFSGGVVPLVSGQQYTLSVYARIIDGDAMRLRMKYGVSQFPDQCFDVTESDWTRFSWTFLYSAAAAGDLTGAGAIIGIGATSYYEGILELCGYQLEKGNKATDWKTAPEDTSQEILDAKEQMMTYAESEISQKADEIEISISTVTGTLSDGIRECRESIAETDETLTGSVGDLAQRVSDQEDALLDYKHETSTYFRFNTDGLNIGKQEDGDESPYSINIDNEKMGFLQNGQEIAYVQYNKMHINAIEAMDRLSVGAATDGGYFDFISTEYGMGVKWRAVANPSES